MKWIAVVVLVCAPAVSCAAAADRDWYTLTIDAQRVGYAWHETRIDAGEHIHSQVMRVYISQLRHSSLIETTTEVARDPSGAPIRIRVQLVNGTDHSGWTGKIANDGRSMEAVTAAKARRKVNLPANLLWPDQLPDTLRRFAAGGTVRTQFKLLDTSTASAVDAVAERVADADLNGTRVRVTVAVPGNSPRVESWWIDAKSRVTRRERLLYGAPLRWENCERNCGAGVAKPFDLMARLIVASPNRIPQNALGGPIRYVISRSDGVAPRLPVTNEQDVVADGQVSVVTICTVCGRTIPPTDAERRKYLASNAWVQTSAKEVQDFSRRNSGKGTPQQVMTELVDAVRSHMTGEVDFLGYASATQALASRSGDCGEFSVLLAAAARARGIPTRLVVGLVYAGRFSGKKDVFSPHVWVQAWTGDRWTSYDAGLERFDATHIALGVGDGDPRVTDSVASAGQWRIEKLGLVK
jgi:transglutaminase-like putative cysteine protease